MTDFLTIDEAMSEFMKGGSQNKSFIATVTKMFDLKSGTKKTGGDWTNKKFTLQDESGTVDITLWDENISKLKVGCKYEFIQPFWTDYNGTPQVTINQYGKITLIGTATQQETIEAKPVESKKPEHILDMSKELHDFTIKQNLILSQITLAVKLELEAENATKGIQTEVRGDVIWVRTLAIYNLWNSNEDESNAL